MAADPTAEAGLLATARSAHLGTVRDEARKVRLAAVDPADLRERQHKARGLRCWRDAEGMVQLAGALAPQDGIPFLHRLDAETDRVRTRARRAGSTESREAHMADALLAMATGTGKTRTRKAEVVFVCDLRAWLRGYAHAGEPVHMIDGGPVPVDAIAEEIAGGAFVKAVVHDGVDPLAVRHLGRYRPAELETALLLGAAPDFDGAVCSTPGCGRRHGLEWDHRDPVASQGPTSYRNLQPLCWPDHQAKTERDRRAGLLRSGRARGGDPP